MKKRVKRITAIIITFSLFFSLVPFVSGDDNDYTNAVIDNFEKSFEESVYFDDICSDRFYYERFYDNMNELNWAEKGVTWCTYSLLDKKINKDAYVYCLSNLLAMMQTSIAEMSYNQVQNSQSENSDENRTKLALQMLFLNKEAADLFEDVTGMMQNVISINDEVEKGTEQMIAVYSSIAIYEKQYTILKSIKNNTSNKKLKSACDEVMEMCAGQCVYISEKCVADSIGFVGKISKGAWESFYEVYAKEINQGFVSWLRGRMSSETSEKVLRMLKVGQGFLQKVAYFKTGLDIGSGIMNLFVGDRVECFREQTILAEIADTLTASLIKTKDKAQSGSDERRYLRIQDFVALAEALIYTHTRGEFCSVQSRKQEELDRWAEDYYESLCPIMEEYSDIVSGILVNVTNGNVLENVLEALDGIESVHMSQTTSSDYEVMGSRVNMDMRLETDVDIENMITHAIMKAQGAGIDVDTEMYARIYDGVCDIYMSTAGMWLKQTGISAGDMYKLGSGFDGMDGIRFYLNNLKDVYVEESENKYTITGVIGSEATEEALRRGGMESMMNQLDSNDSLSDGEIREMFSNLSALKLSVVVNKETFLPGQMVFDMKDTIESLYSNINNIGAKYGEEISYSINENKGTVNFSNYNTVPKIVIPDSALNGRAYVIIQ